MMINITMPLLALVGISLNLAFPIAMTQPDWAVALLLASLLAHRHNWLWVLPCALIHDLVLYWSIGSITIMMSLIPLAMIYLDQHLGAGLPQRIALMLLIVLVLPSLGWSMQTAVLTMCLCMPVWYLLTKQYEKHEQQQAT